MLPRLLMALACLALPRLALACGGPIAEASPLRLAAFAPAGEDTPDPALRITFLGHASFLIETPQHVTAVTDYSGVYVPSFPPDIATMNHAHATHYTDHPDPRIPYVLRGWRDDGGPAHIDLTLRDMHVTNLPTNTRNYATGGTEMFGNSIFVFASAGLCVAHLSHLHHELTAEDVAALGPIDIVMAPVDNYVTLDYAELAQVLDELHAPIVIPMHMFGSNDGERFAATVKDRYRLVVNATPTVTLSRRDIPEHPEILVLPPAQ